MLLNSLEVRLGITGDPAVLARLRQVQTAQQRVVSGGGTGGGGGGTGGGAGGGGGRGAMGPIGDMMRLSSMLGSLYLIGRGVRLITDRLEEAVHAAQDFSREVLNMEALTGATANQAATISTMFKVTDTQGMRDIMKLMEAMKSGQGLGAMGRLGIHVDVNQSGLSTLMQVLEKLKEMPAGPRKSQIEMDIFGMRGVVALQGILRLTKEQMDQIQLLGDSVDGAGIAAIDRMRVSWELLGQTVLQRVIMPLIVALMPALETIVNWMIKLIDWISELERGPGIIIAMALALGLMGAAIAGVLVLLSMMFTAIMANAAAQAVFDALSGAWPLLAAGAIVGAAVGLGAGGWAAYQASQHGDATTDAIHDLHQTVQEIHATMIGGGERSGRVKSELEVEYSLRRMVFTGAG